ncbi:hypothetical protein VKT23_008166 [Stygiomarasmius scandens]|uniref:Uncharacterized protein n=1 Tax=Marasmiellus scandens TaxID=2682957 RepID=A0ABR1JKQ3_9AGAR
MESTRELPPSLSVNTTIIRDPITPQREPTPADPYEMPLFEDSPYLGPTENPTDPDVEMPIVVLPSQKENLPDSPIQNIKPREEEKDQMAEEEPEDEEIINPPEMDPPSENNPFLQYWEIDFKSPTPSLPAPCSLLRFTGIDDMSLDDFRAFLYRTLLWMKPVKEVTIARIVRMIIGEEVQFWTKIYDQEQAGWVVQAYRRMTTERGERLRISLVSLQEWRNMIEIQGDMQWSLPTPLHPHLDPATNSGGPPPRKKQALEDRLQDEVSPQSSLIDRLGGTPSSSSLNCQRRKKARGGVQKKWFFTQHGPLHTVDPIGWEAWDGYQWFQNFGNSTS